MKLALALVVVISTWGMLMVAATSSEIITQPKAKAPPPPPPFPTPETMSAFNLDGSDGASYSKHIGGLRATLTDPERSYCEVPMIKLSPRLQYMYLELISIAGDSITLAIRMNDLYVDGYSYKYRGQELRARFLKLETTAIQEQVKKNLFKDATNSNENKDTGYEGSYGALEAKAALTRKNLKLGSQTLDTYINEITYKDSYKPGEFLKTEARLLLIVIQMVSEAIRFKYMDKNIKDNFSAGYAPDSHAIALQTSWEKITKAIRQGDCSDSKDMGLLKYLASSSLAWPMMQPVDSVTVWAQ